MNDADSVVREFWRLMASNDFASVAAVLADDVVVDWPQSNERLRGPARFAQCNAEYPAHGPWRFTVHRVVAASNEAVTHVGVSDGVQQAEAVSFFTLRDGRIVHIVEYWPEPFTPATDRRHLTEPIA